VLDAAAGALRLLGPFGPFGRGLDVCCGTGAGMRVLRSLCQEPIMGVDFSTGMLAQARKAYPDAKWVRADVRALPFAGAFDLTPDPARPRRDPVLPRAAPCPAACAALPVPSTG